MKPTMEKIQDKNKNEKNPSLKLARVVLYNEISKAFETVKELS
jgi:hypothetical protein